MLFITVKARALKAPSVTCRTGAGEQGKQEEIIGIMQRGASTGIERSVCYVVPTAAGRPENPTRAGRRGQGVGLDAEDAAAGWDCD